MFVYLYIVPKVQEQVHLLNNTHNTRELKLINFIFDIQYSLQSEQLERQANNNNHGIHTVCTSTSTHTYKLFNNRHYGFCNPALRGDGVLFFFSIYQSKTIVPTPSAQQQRPYRHQKKKKTQEQIRPFVLSFTNLKYMHITHHPQPALDIPIAHLEYRPYHLQNNLWKSLIQWGAESIQHTHRIRTSIVHIQICISQ